MFLGDIEFLSHEVFGFSENWGPKVGSPSSQQELQYCTVHLTERYRRGVHVGLLGLFAVPMEDEEVDMEEMTNEEYGWEGAEGVVGWSGSEFWRILRAMVSNRRRSLSEAKVVSHDIGPVVLCYLCFTVFCFGLHRIKELAFKLKRARYGCLQVIKHFNDT